MDQVKDINQQWEVSQFTGMGLTPDQLRLRLGEIVNQLYDDYVERPKMQEEQEIRYGLSIFNADRNTPPDVLYERYTEMHSRLTIFRNILRHESVSLLASAKGRHTSVEAALHVELTDRISRIFEALDAMYEACRGTTRMRQTQIMSHAYPEYPCRFLPGEKTDKDLQYLQRWAYLTLFENKCRRWEGRIMKPIYTSTGHLTRTYKYFCDIDEFFSKHCRREREYDIWQIACVSANRKNVISTLKELDDPLFEDLRRLRYLFTFNNCTYNAKLNTVRMYTQKDWCPYEMSGYVGGSQELREELTLTIRHQETAAAEILTIVDDHARIASAFDDSDVEEDDDEDIDNIGMESVGTSVGEHYRKEEDEENEMSGNYAGANHFDMEFPVQYLHTDAMQIPTPVLDSIFEAQRYKEQPNWEELLMWIYGLMGRMIYDVSAQNNGDNWQIALFFRGLAGTGKGCLMRAVLRKLYQVSDIGILSNNIEKKFGLESLAKCWALLCMEMRGNFSLDIGDFLSMVAAEDMKVSRKNKIALQLIWSSPLCIAGNTTANWTDDGGSLGRRLVPVPMNYYVSKADSTLDDKLVKEFPFILLKINKCYHRIRELVKKNNNNFWGTIPKFFQDERDKLIMQINTFEKFLKSSGICQLACDHDAAQETFYWDWNSLCKAYKTWCNDSSAVPINTSKEDSYAMVIQKFGIRIEKRALHDKNAGCVINKNWAIGVRPSSDVIID